MVDELGHPILLAYPAVQLKSLQDIVHEIFTKAYSKFIFSYLIIIFWLLLVRITQCDKVHVLWLELARMLEKYLDANTIPEGFKILDPSKLTKNRILELWSH